MAEMKARHAFGNLSDVQRALDSGKINEYDILFLDGDTEPKIGWIDAKGEFRLVQNEADFSELEEIISKKADAAEVEAKLTEKANASEVETALASKADAEKVEAMETEIAAKANASDVETLETELDTKVTAEEVKTMIKESEDSLVEIVEF